MIFKYIKIIALIICVGLVNAGVAQQNLVRNYSFENVTSNFTCINSPTPFLGGPSQSDLQAYWDEVSDWTCPDVNSPLTGNKYTITDVYNYWSLISIWNPPIPHGVFNKTGSPDVLCSAELGSPRSGFLYGTLTKRDYFGDPLRQNLVQGKVYCMEINHHNGYDEQKSKSQDSSAVPVLLRKKNNLYIELLGKGIVASINYERIFHLSGKLSLAGHIGFNMNGNPIDIFVFPLSVYSIYRIKKLGIEAGMGGIFVFTTNPDPMSKEEFYQLHPYGSAVYTPKLAVHYVPSIGFRYYFGNLFFMRVNYYPIYQYPYGKTWLHYLGASIGISI